VTRTTHRIMACLIPLIALGLAGCDGQGTDQNAPEGDQAATTSEAAGDLAANGTVVPQIASGTVQVQPTTTGQAAESMATPEGRRRTVPLAEAEGKVPFKLLEPTDLPQGANRGSVVHLMEPFEGQEADYLPAVRMIYDVESGGSIILLQSPARDAVIDGVEKQDMDGRVVYLQRNGEQTIAIWEQDGVNLELRVKGLSDEQMKAIILSMAPLGSAPAEPAATSGTPGS
jgi:hypothetical protein